MGRSGDCVTCDNRKRPAIETARAKGESFASIARRFGLAEASVRRHFKAGHVRPPEPKPAQKRNGGLVTRQHLEGVAAEFGLTLRDLLRHHVLCLGGDVVTSSDEEARELCELLGDGTPCCGVA